MAQGKQQPKFERNPCIRFRDILRHGRTTDKFRFPELCRHSQAELKIQTSNCSAVSTEEFAGCRVGGYGFNFKGILNRTEISS